MNIHATAQLQVVLVKPERFEDASTVADHLNAKRTVVLNLESANKDVARRILDFLSGVAYANDGQIKKVANCTFIITPYNVGVMGDLWMNWRTMASTSNRADKEASGLRARIKDAARLSGVRRRPCYIGFLDDGERAEAEVILRGGAYASYGRRFYGGYEEAERVMLGLSAEGPPEPETFPLTALLFRYRREASITHRDVLGSLLSCGVRRDKLGDILCGREDMVTSRWYLPTPVWPPFLRIRWIASAAKG